MSSAAPTEPTAQTASTASKKKKNKKKNTAKPKNPAEATIEADQAENEDVAEPDTPGMNEQLDGDASDTPAQAASTSNGHASSNGHPTKSASPGTMADGDPTARLEAMTQEREALRVEVEQLRKQLESVQQGHAHEVEQLKSDLEESETAKESAEEQYQTLMDRVEKIKVTMSERLKRDKADLEERDDRIEELEKQNEELQKGSEGQDEAVQRLSEELQESNRELTSLRSRNNLSAQNWIKEKEDYTRQIHHLKAELDSTSSAMGEWEVIAMEERSTREVQSERVTDLEEQLTHLRDAYERATSERDTQSQAIDGLQRALQEIQEARKKELREMVESSDEQLQRLKKLVQEADSRAAEAEAAREKLAKEVERTAPFEEQIKEKNLLLGKSRHEAIILNDHLARALRYLKKVKPEDNVDRQIVTNYFLQFLALDRSDPKKFQILQVIAGYLNWTDEQKEQAGLARPGASSSSLRLPISPFHRTPSTPSLSTEFFSEPTPTSGKESIADLWAGFLERSADEGASDVASRRGSVASQSTNATRPDTKGGGQ